MKREGRKGLKPEMAAGISSLSVEEMLSKVAEIREKTGEELILADPMAVCGKDHIISAFLHAKRAVERGYSVSKDFSAEFLRYLTGERQISRAIKKGGVKDSNVVVISGIPVKDVLKILMIERNDALLDCTEKKLRYLGIDGDAEDMVLEMVAMVEIL